MVTRLTGRCLRTRPAMSWPGLCTMRLAMLALAAIAITGLTASCSPASQHSGLSASLVTVPETLRNPATLISGDRQTSARDVARTQDNVTLLHQEGMPPGEDLKKSIFSLMEKGDKRNGLAAHRDIVILLGNTGSGKSTLTQFLAGNNTKLISEEIEKGLGLEEFIIVDSDDRIGSSSTAVSKTIFPEPTVDENTKTTYYDCPGFSDTRGVAQDISQAYFMKRLIDSADRVKLVFVVNHSSVKKAVDRQDFVRLIKHSSTLIRDTEKFNAIGNFIQEVKGNLEEGQLESYFKNSTLKRNAIKFLEGILFKKNKVYERIGIFKRPDVPGVVSNISLLQNCKKELEFIIHQNLVFRKKNDEDFGYTISAESENHAEELIKYALSFIEDCVRKIGKEVTDFYRATETKLSMDIVMLKERFQSLLDLLSAVDWQKSRSTAENLSAREFVQHISNITKYMGLKISSETMSPILNYGRYLSFLQKVSGKRTFDPLPWAQGLQGLIQNSQDSKQWYDFLTRLYDMLSGYSVQENRSTFNIPEVDMIQNINDTRLTNLFQHVGIDIPFKLMDSSRQKTLREVIRATVNHKVTLSREGNSKSKLVLRGRYVKLSEISQQNVNCKELNEIIVFAYEKVFIDTDLDCPGVASLTVVSPSWYITNTTKIVVDGKQGAALTKPTADAGVAPGSNGKNGKDGEPGEPGGLFFGIGEKFVNLHLLTVSANGGKGGHGQRGGDGKNGVDGKSPPDTFRCKGDLLDVDIDLTVMGESHGRGQVNPKSHNRGDLFPGHYYQVAGPMGTKGGSGGDGGRGGKGGKPGNVTVLGLMQNPNVKVQVDVGADGIPGAGGAAGLGGSNSNVVAEVHCHTVFVCGCVESYRGEWGTISRRARSGTTGKAGGNVLEGKNSKILPFDHYDKVLRYERYYREYVAENKVSQLSSMKILELLDENSQIKVWHTTLGLFHEFQDLEEQYYKLVGKIPLKPAYQLLLEKISGYAKNLKDIETRGDDKSVLRYLFTACLSKICSMRDVSEGNLIIDLEKFVASAVENVEKMAKAFNHNEITASSKRFSEDIQSKTDEAGIFMSEITSDVDNFLYDIDNNIQRLINETVDLQNAAKKERDRLIEQEKELNTQLGFRKLLGVVNVASQLLSFLGPAGAAAATAVGGAAMTTEALLLDDRSSTGQDKLLELPKGVTLSASKITDEIKNKNRVLSMQLRDVALELKKFEKDEPHANLTEILHKVDAAQSKLKKENDKISALDLKAIKMYETQQQEISTLINEKKIEIKREKNPDAVNVLQAKLDSLFEEKRAASPNDLPRVNNAILELEKKIKQEIETNHDLDIESFHRKRTMQREKDELTKVQQQKLVGKNYEEYTASEKKRQNLHRELETLTEQSKTAVPKTLTDTTRELHYINKRLLHLKENTDAKSVSEKQELEKRQKLFLERKKYLYEDRKEKVTQRVEEGTRRMEHVLNIIRISDITVSTYSRIRNSEAKIKQVAAAIEGAKIKLQSLLEHEQKIYDIMLPLADTMKQSINEMGTTLAVSSRVALDVRKWKMQLALRNIREEMQKLFKGFTVEERFKSAFQNLEEGIGVLIQVYKDVETYQEQNLLALYLADISKESSIEVQVKDKKLKEAMEKLNVALRANLVIKEFEMVSSAFKQLVFPFALNYLEEFSLPTYLQLNYRHDNISAIASSVADKLTKFKKMITKQITTTEEYDQYIRSAAEFKSDTVPFEPFFVWRNNSNSYAISNFLDGMNVTLFANIREGVPKNAIKFNEIGVLLKTVNRSEQLKLDEMLTPHDGLSFEVSMTHLGISDYRCGTKFYTVTNKPHTFNYIYHPDGTKSNPNEMVKKIKNGSPMLSPYTPWRIQLTGTIPVGLQKYKNKIDIELMGRGQYTDRKGVDDKVCNTDLDSFYVSKDDTSSRDDFGLMQESEFPYI
ncbi:uncharacterized protein LOC117650350 [Thrips palmi]|uniref:Uncharacterized protein LOC117650350 n=1 Tax=Thrips palmi TaxID=161013 RepID=A0A6P8ZW64_THRPL|nr:uncharacterized protein LOC117650350 [Thrips palmi]